ncbi:hypothetical protein GINT2_002119 [Glugoides intestinalis]
MKNLFFISFFIFLVLTESNCRTEQKNMSDEGSEALETDELPVIENSRKYPVSFLEEKLSPIKTLFSQSSLFMMIDNNFIKAKRTINALRGMFSTLDVYDCSLPVESITKYETPDDITKMLASEMLRLIYNVLLNSYKNFNTQLKRGNDDLYCSNPYKSIKELEDDMHFMATIFLSYLLNYGTESANIKTLLYKAFRITEDVTTIGFLDFLKHSFKEENFDIDNDQESVKKVAIPRIANAMLHIKDEDIESIFIYKRYSIFCVLLQAIFPVLKDFSSVCYLQLFKLDWGFGSPQRQLIFPCYEYLRVEVLNIVEKYKTFEEICPKESYRLDAKDDFLIPISFATIAADSNKPTALKERELDFAKFVYFLGLFVFMRLDSVNPLSEKYNNMCTFITKLSSEENCVTLFTTVGKILKVPIKLIEFQNHKDIWQFYSQEANGIDTRLILKVNKHLYLYTQKKPCENDSK